MRVAAADRRSHRGTWQSVVWKDGGTTESGCGEWGALLEEKLQTRDRAHKSKVQMCKVRLRIARGHAGSPAYHGTLSVDNFCVVSFVVTSFVYQQHQKPNNQPLSVHCSLPYCLAQIIIFESDLQIVFQFFNFIPFHL